MMFTLQHCKSDLHQRALRELLKDVFSQKEEPFSNKQIQGDAKAGLRLPIVSDGSVV